jgi:hypothetical protein
MNAQKMKSLRQQLLGTVLLLLLLLLFIWWKFIRMIYF